MTGAAGAKATSGLGRPSSLIAIFFIMGTLFAKLLSTLKIYQSELITALAVALITIISFQAGKIYQSGTTSSDSGQAAALSNLLEVGDPNPANPAPGAGDSKPTSYRVATPIRTDLRVVASKNSKTTKKYHYLWCGSAKRILEANRIYFASAAEAETQGYTLAGNCTK